MTPIYRYHFLSPENTGCYIDKSNVSFEELKDVLPDVNVDSKENQMLAKAMEKDKENEKSFVASKLLAIVKCDYCGGTRCIYTHKGGQSQTQLNILERRMDNGYVCGNKFPVKGFSVQRKHMCGYYIESQY